ncbi:Uncharacterised protein [Mycobacterium tuberculosis]|uniref:Uncharacterized protein n=1 Tax=Mycobacterium tuberculosis TaxID=1773 RepID=A0A655FUU5_MYCTX|nr:Uncharacterised protein [Mycobacterium tuberculosis]
MARDVGAGYRHRTHLTQQLDGDRVQRHSQHHGAMGIAKIPLQRRRLHDHQAERAGPECANQFAGTVGHRVDQPLDRVPRADQHTYRHIATPPLCRQQRGHRGAVEGVGADPIHRVRRHHHQLARLDCPYRRDDSTRTLLGVGAVERLSQWRRFSSSLRSASSLARVNGAVLPCKREVPPPHRRHKPRPSGQIFPGLYVHEKFCAADQIDS